MKNSFPRLFARKLRLCVLCLVLIALVAFSISVSSHSGGAAADASNGVQQAGAASIIANVFNFPMPLPTITASKADSFPAGYDVDGDGKADVGDKIRYTVNVKNTSATDDATNLTLLDTVDVHTTFDGASLVISPLAANETYQSVGNMTLTTASIGANCAANNLHSVTCNDTLRGATVTGFGDTQANANANAPGNTLTIAGKGTVVLNADGTFVFNPVGGYEGSVDFWYTINNSAGSDNAKVTINVGGANGMVWFINNNAGGSTNQGTQANPFTLLSAFAALNNGTGSADTKPDAGNTIFLYESSTSYAGPVTLLNNQIFIGQDATTSLSTLGAPAAQPGNAYPSMNPSVTNVTITSAGLGITLASGNTLSGFSMSGVGATALSGTNFGTLKLSEVNVSSSSQALSLTTGALASPTGGAATFGTLTSGALGSNGVLLSGVTGAMSATGGTLTGGATDATFKVTGGSVSVTYSGGITQAANNAAVSITDHTTGTITFQTGTINATNGTGLQFTNADGTYNFNGPTTLNGGDAGIDILAGTDATNGSNGTFTFETGTAITRANSVSGAAFNLAGSDGSVTYKGSMTLGTSTGNMVAINDHNTGTITFQTGNLTKGSSTTQGISIQNVNSGTVNFNNPTIAITMTSGKAVALATNTGGTINFTPAGGGNGIDLTSTTATTFDATGGGTVVVTGSGNTLSSTTGIALNVTSTTIGASGLNFVSINAGTAASGPANGIVLNTTGNQGGLTVAGTGSAGTGGTIQKATGDGISLTSTEKVSLSWMNITSNLGSGIGGSTINGFQLNNLSITSNGDNAATDDSGINVTQLFGTASGGLRPTSITNCTISNNWEFQIQITNSSGTLTDLTMSGNTISNTGANGIIGNLFNFLGGGTSVMKLSLTSGSFTGAAPATADAISGVLQGTTHTLNISGATFNNNNVGVDCSTTNAGGMTLNCNVSNNSFQGTRAQAINFFQNGNPPFNRTFNGTVNNNTIGTAGTNLSGSATGNGISVGDEGAISTMRVTITNNTITETLATGIAVDIGLFNATTGGGTAQVTIQGNNFSNIDSRAIHVQDNQDPQSPFPSVCSNITGNTFGANITGQAGNGQVIRLKQTNGTHSIPQASIAALEAANTGATGKVGTSGTITFNGPTCALSTAMLNVQGTRNEYFAENTVEQTLAGEAFALLRSEGNNESIAETLNHVPPVEAPATTEKSIFSFDYVIKSAASTQPEATSSLTRPEIEKGAFSLAHAETTGASLTGRAGDFISTVAEAIAPTAHAAYAPQPMPAGPDINQNLGTLPAGKSLTVVFDVTVNGPYPFASYSNQMTVKADGIADVLTDDPGINGANTNPPDPTVTQGDRYNTTTSLTAVPASPSFVGDTITFVAIVTPTEGSGVTPDGNIQFKDGVTNLGSTVPCVADLGSTCKAQLPTSALTAGAHNITAEYAGGTNHDPSTSNTVSYTVNACTPNPVVLNTSDGTTPVPAGSLREAITSACTNSTITFNAGVTGQINLVAALPDISHNLTITGPGASTLEVRGSQTLGNTYRVFNVASGITVNISGLTLSNGSDALGGGAINNTGTLTLTEMAIGNASTSSGNSTTGSGGGIQNSGTLTLIRSTVSNNVASLNGGGISNTGTLTITNSTISNNTANAPGVGLGGGIYNSSGVNPVNLSSATVAANTSDASGGGIYNAGGTINFANTLVADNNATASKDLAGAGIFNSQDYNLFENFTVVFTGTTTHDKTNVDPVLGPLANNGGATYTHRPLGNSSPIIDAGNTTLTVDQRNQPREVDNLNVPNAGGGDASDIGAYESPAPPNAPDLDAASDTGTVGDNITSDNTPTFTIGNVITGASVDLLMDGTIVATGTVSTTCLGLPCIQLTPSSAVADGAHVFVAQQTVAGGLSPTSVGRNVTIDTGLPATALIDLQDGSDTGFSNSDNITNAATLSFDIGNTEAGALVELYRDAALVASVTSAGGTVTLQDTPGEGFFTYTAKQIDTAGNNTFSAGLGVAVDRTGPSVSSITRINPTPTGVPTVNYNVTFDQPVTGVDATDFTVTQSGVSGASVTALFGTAPSTGYQVSVGTGTGDGTIRLDITDDDTIADVAGNPLGGTGAGNGNFTTGEVYVIDKTDPSVSSIVRASANPTKAASVDFTVTFSEGVSGVDTTDFSLTATGVAGASVTGVTPVDASHYTVAVNTGTGDGTIRLDVTDNDSIVDQASKPIGGVGANNGDFTGGQVYDVDKTAPTINIGSPSQTGAKNGDTITFDITYGDTNFNTSTLATGDITLNKTGTANATVSVDAGNGTTRTVTLTNITGNGTLGISIAAGTASDNAGNAAPAAGPSATFIVDTVAPTVSSIVRADTNPTGAASVNFTVTFSEGVSGVDTTDFSLTTTGTITGASVTGVTPVDASHYTVTVNTGSNDGTIRLDVTDNDSIVDQASNPLGGTGAGNGNFITGEVYTIDKNAPSASITAVTPDPRNTSVGSITIVFTEAVTGFDLADLSLTRDGGANLLTGAQTLTSGDNITWTLGNLSGLTGTEGTYQLTLTASGSGITDNGSNPLTGDASDTWVTDTTPPTVTIDQASTQADPVLNASGINFTVVFNEPVTGFDSADVTFSGAGATTATVTEIAPNNGTHYNVEISGMNTSGIVTASVNKNAAQDAAGNLSDASTSTDNQVLNQKDNATGFEVNNLADDDDGACTALGTGNGCTLREAINAANLDGGSETITFAPALTSGGPAQITQTLGALPDITDGVTITGPTNNRLTISGNLSSRIFTIAPGQTVAISNLTFIDGRDPVGGAIYSLGDLTITNSTFTGNKAIGPTAEGGAIDSEGGTLTIINSTISGNSSDADGGGLLNCGTSTATLVNVTITGNRSDADDASPGDGGGLAQVSSNPVTLINTIVAGNLKGTASPTADDIFVLGGSGGFNAATKNNLIGDVATSGGLTNGTNGNIVGNAGVGTIDINTVLKTTLASNGGPTQTHLLLPGSPAVGTGSNCVTLAGGCLPTPLTTDQRGTGFPRLVGTTVDIGAVEVDYFIQPIAGAPQSTLIGTDFPYPSKIFITESNKLVTGIPVIFDAPTSGPSGTFPGNLTSIAINTDVNGIAITPTFTANNIAGGPYTMTAHIPGTSLSTPIGDLTNLKLPAQITLGNLVQTYDGTPKAVSVTTNPPGLTVVVTYDGSTTPPTNVKPGGYAVVATINDPSYDGQTTSTLTIDKANQTITFGPLAAKTFGDPDFTLNATTDAAGLSVSYAASGQCTVAGNTVHLTGAGSCTITASQGGDANRNPASNVSQTFAINKANQTITLPPIANKTFGDADFPINPSASSGLDVGIVGTGNCYATGNVVHLTGAGSCTITVTQDGNTNYNPAPNATQTFQIAQAATNTALASSVNPSDLGQNVTFTATVSSTAGTPTGTVQFAIDGTNTGAPVALNGSGSAAFSTSTLAAGGHTVTASYSGDVNFAASNGTLAGGQVVNIQTSLSINDISLIEGNSGTKNFTFTVSLSQASNLTVAVDFSSANGTATAPDDYQSTTGTLTFLPGDLTKTVTVLVNGDTVNEANETFFLNLTNAQNASISDSQGQGTIQNDDAPGVQFSANSFSFNEGAGHGDIVVQRTGDVSQAMTVDYMTSDQSGMTPCQTLNTGIASDRCDYATAAGILHFAAGEAQKVIPLVLVNDAYVEGAEQLSIKLINPTGGSLGSVDTATVTIVDNDTQVATQNPIDNLDFFIRQLYIDFLGREPDAAGFQFWKTRMTSPCPAGQQCDRIDTALRFFNSDEFDQRGYFTYLFYHAALGRRPTYSEWIMDVAKLNGFQTPAEQQASRDAFINEFMNRQEFMNLYNGAQTADTFVDALIQKSGVNPASRQALINNYATVGRAGTLKAFMETPEVQAQFKDRAFVTMLYFGFLRRDAEPGGFAFWMQKLNDTNHDYRQLIGGFIDSDEFYYRYAQIH